MHKVGLLCRMRLSVNGNFFEIPIERNGLHDSAPDLILHLIFSGSMLLKSLRVHFPRAVGLKIVDSETILRKRGEVGSSRLSSFIYVISVSGSFPAFCGGLVMLQIRLYWASGTRLVSQHIKGKAKKDHDNLLIWFTCFIDNFLSHWP